MSSVQDLATHSCKPLFAPGFGGEAPRVGAGGPRGPLPGTQLTRDSVGRSCPPGGGAPEPSRWGRPLDQSGGEAEPVFPLPAARGRAAQWKVGSRSGWSGRAAAAAAGAADTARRRWLRQSPGHGPGAPPCSSHTPPGPRALSRPEGVCVRTRLPHLCLPGSVQGFGFGASRHLILSPQRTADLKGFLRSRINCPEREARCLLRRAQQSAWAAQEEKKRQ